MMRALHDSLVYILYQAILLSSGGSPLVLLDEHPRVVEGSLPESLRSGGFGTRQSPVFANWTFTSRRKRDTSAGGVTPYGRIYAATEGPYLPESGIVHPRGGVNRVDQQEREQSSREASDPKQVDVLCSQGGPNLEYLSESGTEFRVVSRWPDERDECSNTNRAEPTILEDRSEVLDSRLSCVQRDDWHELVAKLPDVPPGRHEDGLESLANCRAS